MREPLTLILDEDERTAVGPPCSLRAAPAADREAGAPGVESFARRLRVAVWARGSWALLTFAIATLSTICVLALWVHRERRVAARLRDAISDLGTAEQPSLRTVTSTDVSDGNHRVPFLDEPPESSRDVQSVAQLTRRGAAFLVENRLSDALGVYLDLAVRRPDERVFADIVEVLETKVVCETSSRARKPRCD